MKKAKRSRPRAPGVSKKSPKALRFRPSAAREHLSGEHQVQRVSDHAPLTGLRFSWLGSHFLAVPGIGPFASMSFTSPKTPPVAKRVAQCAVR